MLRNQRRRLLVDRNLQGALLRRGIVYWLLFASTLIVLSAVWIVVSAGPLSPLRLLQRMSVICGPAFLASAALLPIFAVDSVRLSNRFAGPLHRLQRVMREASAGARVRPVCFRKEDYWREFAEDFNRLVAAQSQAANELAAAGWDAAEISDRSADKVFAEV